ncbi:hypothetical protein ABEB36_000192 [Hypothenemus hampei]|uniref:Protein ALP1-like n=1 Tax=Hypothenemus hampei TaxID=57062 RepID=A0ABD1FE48_HYPHA
MNFGKEELAIIAVLLDEEETSKKKRRRVWIHKAWTKRDTEGEYATLFKELVDDEVKFHQYFRMNYNIFTCLLNKIKDRIQKQDTFWRKSIEAQIRLAVCLRYVKINATSQI